MNTISADEKIKEIVQWLIRLGYTPDDDDEIQFLFSGILRRRELGEIIDTVKFSLTEL